MQRGSPSQDGEELEPGPVSEPLDRAATGVHAEPQTMADLMAGRRAAAAAYLRAISDHDPDDVPFARRCLRTENGLPTGFTAADLRFQLRHSPAYRIVRDVREVEITSIGDRVHAGFLLDSGIGPLRMTVRVSEWFWFDGGLITRISARIRRA